jgi:ABC-type transporter Mla subunit MlaD
VRRLLVIGLALLGAGAAGIATAAGGGEQTYRVDAIFDNAASLVPGNVVKIAGAPAGTVKDIRLTSRRRARVEMEIQRGFAPFRSDARCVIAPESLFIGEKFVQCKPGTPRGHALASGEAGVPTVPLERNSAGVDLDLVLSTLRLPVRQRLTILFTELGAGLAGRPRELSAAVRRANPALDSANRVLRILDDDRSTLTRLVGRSDQVIGELAARRKNVQGFITRAGQVTEATAARRDQLQETVRRLPPLLDQLEPSAKRLGELARQATPALRDLHTAAPAVTALLGDVDPLSKAGRPAVAELGRTARIGRHAVKPARPVARQLRSTASHLPRAVSLLTGITESLRDSGAIEGLQSFLYYTALSTSRFDRISHMVPAYVLFGDCMTYVQTPNKKCDAHFGGSAVGASAQRRSRPARRRSRPASRRRSRSRAAPGPTPAPAAPAAPPARAGAPQAAPPAPAQGGQSVTGLLDYLLKP